MRASVRACVRMRVTHAPGKGPQTIPQSVGRAVPGDEKIHEGAGARVGRTAAMRQRVSARRVHSGVEILLGGKEEEAEHAQVHHRRPRDVIHPN